MKLNFECFGNFEWSASFRDFGEFFAESYFATKNYFVANFGCFQWWNPDFAAIRQTVAVAFALAPDLFAGIARRDYSLVCLMKFFRAPIRPKNHRILKRSPSPQPQQ